MGRFVKFWAGWRWNKAGFEKNWAGSEIVPEARYAMTIRSLLLQLGVGGCCKPPSRSRAEPWWGSRGQRPRKLRTLCSLRH